MSAWDAIVRLDRRWLYLVLVIITVYPLAYPIGLPVPISDMTQQFYDGIDAIPEGSVIVLSWATRFGRPTKMSLMEDVTKHMMTKNVYQIHVSFDKSMEGGEVAERIFRKIDPEKNYGKEYGVDYINFGQAAGGEAALAGFLDDAHKTFTLDQRGTPIQQYEITEKIKTGADIDYVFCTGTEHYAWVGQAQPRFGTIIFAGSDAGEVTEIIPYVESGQISGALNDMMGAAEYETLIKQAGEGLKATDPLNTIQFYQAGVIIVTNVVFLLSRLGRKED